VTASRDDLQDRCGVQRAWEVQQTTERAGRVAGRDATPSLPLDRCQAHSRFSASKTWLNGQDSSRRLDQMLGTKALWTEVAAGRPVYDPTRPGAIAPIGVPEADALS